MSHPRDEAWHTRPVRSAPSLKKPCQGDGCGRWTTLSCVRCMRALCASDAAINLATMTHADGSVCVNPSGGSQPTGPVRPGESDGCTCPMLEVTSMAELAAGKRVYLPGSSAGCPVHGSPGAVPLLTGWVNPV